MFGVFEEVIISTWIDEAGPGQTVDKAELAQRCIEEVKASDLFVLFCKPGEHLKGALVELGAALAYNKEVRCVGNCASLSPVFINHKLWRWFPSVELALTWTY